MARTTTRLPLSRRGPRGRCAWNGASVVVQVGNRTRRSLVMVGQYGTCIVTTSAKALSGAGDLRRVKKKSTRGLSLPACQGPLFFTLHNYYYSQRHTRRDTQCIWRTQMEMRLHRPLSSTTSEETENRDGSFAPGSGTTGNDRHTARLGRPTERGVRALPTSAAATCAYRRSTLVRNPTGQGFSQAQCAARHRAVAVLQGTRRALQVPPLTALRTGPRSWRALVPLPSPAASVPRARSAPQPVTRKCTPQEQTLS